MIPCPKCNGTLEVSAERILVQPLTFSYRKRGKGIKKQNTSFKRIGAIPVESRVFFHCDRCSFHTNNLSTGTASIEDDYPDLLPFKEEIYLIIDQIDEMPL